MRPNSFFESRISPCDIWWLIFPCDIWLVCVAVIFVAVTFVAVIFVAGLLAGWAVLLRFGACTVELAL